MDSKDNRTTLEKLMALAADKSATPGETHEKKRRACAKR